MRIQNIIAGRSLTDIGAGEFKSAEKLSSGCRAGRAGDDAAGSDRIMNDVRGEKSLNQALLIESGMGKGGLAAGDFQESDIIADNALNQPLFSLNTDYRQFETNIRTGIR